MKTTAQLSSRNDELVPSPILIDANGSSVYTQIAILNDSINVTNDLAASLADILSSVICPEINTDGQGVCGEEAPACDLARDILFARTRLEKINVQLRDIKVRIKL